VYQRGQSIKIWHFLPLGQIKNWMIAFKPWNCPKLHGRG
jgi:hypothetical protein